MATSLDLSKTQVKELNASNNKLTTLPQELGNLKNLQELDVEDNELNSLPSIGKLENLKKLFIDNNNNLKKR